MVKRQLIPKSGGGMRELGIPTVLDRFIQQALLQVLQPLFDPTFSRAQLRLPTRTERTRGRMCRTTLRPGRTPLGGGRGPGEVLRPRQPRRADGEGWRSASADRRVLGLIRRYLEAGIMANGVVIERHEGTPQGGPLSPLLANVLLDEVDKELEKRGHRFVRYADDCNVYVRSRRAGERGHGAAAAALRGAPAPRQRIEKRGGPGGPPQIPGLLVLGSPRKGRPSPASPPPQTVEAGYDDLPRTACPGMSQVAALRLPPTVDAGGTTLV